MAEIKVHILFHNEKYHVVLEHPDNSVEISDQGYATREECEKAIDKYVIDRGVQLARIQ
jgi:hypothetical protein